MLSFYFRTRIKQNCKMQRDDYKMVINKLNQNLNAYYSPIKRQIIDEKQSYYCSNRQNMNAHMRKLISNSYNYLVGKLRQKYRNNLKESKVLIMSQPYKTYLLNHPVLQSVKRDVYYVKNSELLPRFQRAYPIGFLFTFIKNIDDNIISCIR